MDPVLQIPFAEVPSSLLPAFGFLQPLALYFCDTTVQVVGREKKTLATFVSKDALCFAKKDSGQLARRIPFTAIRSLHSNCTGATTAPASNDAKHEVFVMFLLSPQERTDLILVGPSCEKFLLAFKRIWAATGFQGRAAWEQDPKRWKRFTDFQKNYRIPQSSREGSPSINGIDTKAAVLKSHNESILSQDFPDEGQGGASSHAAGNNNNNSMTPRTTTFRDPVTGTESPSYIAMGDYTTFNQKVELPYVSFAADERVAFPQMSAPDRSLFYCERRHVFHTGDGASTSSGALVNCFLMLSDSHLYCAVSEERVLRCCLLKHISKLWWVRDVSEAPFSASGTIVNDKTNAHAVLIQFAEQSDGLTSPSSGQRSKLVRVEHDVLLLFSREDEMKAFSGVLERIMVRAHPTNGARFAASTSLGHTSPILAPQSGFQLTVAPLPQKLSKSESDELARAKENGGASSASPAGRDSSPKALRSPSGSPQLDRAKSTLQSRKSVLSQGYLGSFRQQQSASDDYTGLMSIVREDPHLQEEFPVSAELKERHPPLRTGFVYWAERVVYHPSPLRKQAGQRSSEIVVAFLTKTQFVIGSNGQNLRILPIASIKAIRVKTIARKSGEHNRQVIVLVGNQQEHDVCIEVDREEEGRVMLHQLLNVIKKADPYNVPAIKSFSDVEAEGFRFEANKFYKQPDLDLPLSNDTVAYRREIRQRILNLYKKYQPQKVDRVDPLMKEFAGKELELIEKMREKFGANSTELDKTNDDLFGYRRRLVAYCEKYLPESIDSVDRVLREYRGQEERMFDILVKRFGPEPKDPVITPAAKESALRREQSKVFLGKMPAKERLLRIYKQYQPSKIGMIDEILRRYEGHEEVLFRKLEKLYGPEPEADAETISKKSAAALKKAPDQPGAAASELDTWNGVSLGERVAAMCRRYTPGKVHTIPEVLEQFKGKEKLLLDGLVKKYGPEPIPTTPQSRDRLAAFFANHMAERMPDERLNEILLSFRGSEAELYESLAKRYGATGPFTAKGGVASIVKPNQKQHRKQSVVATDSSDDEPDAPADDNGDATFDVYETNSTGTGAPNNSADGSRALTSPTGEVERMRSARRRRATSALTAGAIRSAKKEDKFEAVVLEKMDMLTELPFAEVPVPVQHLFPTFGGRAAIFMFERVLHWEPSTPPALRFMYMTSSHIYISSSETMVHRCFPIRELRGVYMTTKRTDQASQCSVLLKLQPYEHDCFFSVETDFEAKRFVWILLEVQHKYLQQAAQCRVVPVSSLLAPGIDAQCRPKEGFGVQIEPVRKRHRALNDGDAHGSVALGELFSRLHEAVIEKNIDIEEDAEMEIQEAALMTRKSRGVLELSSKDKKVFGHGGSTRLQHQALRARLGSPASGDLDEVQLGVSDYQAAMLTGGDAGTRRPGDTRARFAHRGIDENPNERGENGIPFETREAQRRHLNPVQREQFFLHSHSGIYGTAVSGSLNGAARGDMFAVNGDVDGEIAQGPMAFAEADDPLAAHIPSNHNADGAYRGSSITSSSGLGAHQHLSHEEQLMQSGILGMSEVYEPSPLDRMGLFGKTSTTTPSRPPPKSAFSTGLVTPPPPQNVLSVQHFKGTSAVGSDKRKLMEAAQNSIHRALGQQTGGRVTHIHTMSPLSPQDGNSIAHYANVAVAPPPSQQMQFHHSMNTSGGGDFDDYIAGSARKR